MCKFALGLPGFRTAGPHLGPAAQGAERWGGQATLYKSCQWYGDELAPCQMPRTRPRQEVNGIQFTRVLVTQRLSHKGFKHSTSHSENHSLCLSQNKTNVSNVNTPERNISL